MKHEVVPCKVHMGETVTVAEPEAPVYVHPGTPFKVTVEPGIDGAMLAQTLSNGGMQIIGVLVKGDPIPKTCGACWLCEDGLFDDGCGICILKRERGMDLFVSKEDAPDPDCPLSGLAADIKAKVALLEEEQRQREAEG